MQSLLHSRKFWLTVYALVQTIAAHYLNLPADVSISLDALVLFLIGAIAYEDGEKAKGQAAADLLEASIQPRGGTGPAVYAGDKIG